MKTSIIFAFVLIGISHVIAASTVSEKLSKENQQAVALVQQLKGLPFYALTTKKISNRSGAFIEQALGKLKEHEHLATYSENVQKTAAGLWSFEGLFRQLNGEITNHVCKAAFQVSENNPEIIDLNNQSENTSNISLQLVYPTQILTKNSERTFQALSFFIMGSADPDDHPAYVPYTPSWYITNRTFSGKNT